MAEDNTNKVEVASESHSSPPRNIRKQLAAVRKRLELVKIIIENLEKQLPGLGTNGTSTGVSKGGDGGSHEESETAAAWGQAEEDDTSDSDQEVPADTDKTEFRSLLEQMATISQQACLDVIPTRRNREKKAATASDKPREARVRASKVEYRKLDELWSKNKHDFYLAESSPSPSGLFDEWEEYIFIVRKKFDFYNKPQKTYVDVKSSLLRNILREVLEGVHGVGLREDKPSIEKTILFNVLPALQERCTALTVKPADGDKALAGKHLQVLIDYLKTEFASVAHVLYPMLDHEEISYDLLWALFVPNTFVYTTCPGTRQPRCVKLDYAGYKCTQGRQWFQLDCHFIDYDGKNYRKSTVNLDLDPFFGSVRIDTLSAFPLAYHTEELEARSKLVDRGRKFGTLGGPHHKFFDGPAFIRQKEPPKIRRIHVRGRIMVDSHTFRRINPDYENIGREQQGRVAIRIMRSGEVPIDLESSDEEGVARREESFSPSEDEELDDADQTSCNPSTSFDVTARPQRLYRMGADRKLELTVSTSKGEARRKKVRQKTTVNFMAPENMEEEQLLICSPTVLGFSFVDKQWLEFSVEHISDVEFSPNAFESLVMPEEKKTMVKALVQSHVGGGKSTTVDDVISGKGRGLVAVLHGRPGVGKTLTAEGIADHLERPLYMVSAGELGIDASTLEKRLTTILDISFTWNAVLLIDEADVFLERRSVHDLQRNSLVSIFLRVLEYFEGILFLTTNRVETFDEAFQSRIHIALKYDNLDRKAQATIWSSFLLKVAMEEIPVAERADTKKTREIITKQELDKICRRNLNGRQIKNAVRSAQAMAANMKEKLSFKHINLVLDITQSFEHDLKGTGQLDSMMSYA